MGEKVSREVANANFSLSIFGGTLGVKGIIKEKGERRKEKGKERRKEKGKRKKKKKGKGKGKGKGEEKN